MVLFFSLHLFLYCDKVQRMTFLTEHTSTIKCDSEGVLGAQRTGALKASFSVVLDTCAIMTQHLAPGMLTNVRAISDANISTQGYVSNNAPS